MFGFLGGAVLVLAGAFLLVLFVIGMQSGETDARRGVLVATGAVGLAALGALMLVPAIRSASEQAQQLRSEERQQVREEDITVRSFDDADALAAALRQAVHGDERDCGPGLPGWCFVVPAPLEDVAKVISDVVTRRGIAHWESSAVVRPPPYSRTLEAPSPLGEQAEFWVQEGNEESWTREFWATTHDLGHYRFFRLRVRDAMPGEAPEGTFVRVSYVPQTIGR